MRVGGERKKGAHKNQSTDVESDMPMSRTESGYASAEYMERSEPSQGAYGMQYR